MADAVAATTFEGHDAVSLARRLGLPRVELFSSVTSTLDVAHGLARDGVPDMTLVLTDEQTRGRGRDGKDWNSARGSGLWTTFILRPHDASAIAVLSLRIGLALSQHLDSLAGDTIRVKWPNDLYLGDGKLAGILAEARWREREPEWVALGIGINVATPHDVAGAAGFPSGVTRLAVLAACSAAVREAASGTGPLSAAEREAYHARDLARGRRCTRPRPGVVAGVAADGALLIRDGEKTHAVYAGSLRFAEN